MSRRPTDPPLDVLAHDAWPGFPKAFAIVFVAAMIYLTVVLVASLGAWQPAAHGGPPAATGGH
jgi:hypothetical protein